MGTTILKALLLTISVVSILTLGARSQISRRSQSFAENTKFPSRSAAIVQDEVDGVEAGNSQVHSSAHEALVAQNAAADSSENPTVSESDPYVFDPLAPNQDELWYAFDSSTNSIVIAKSHPTPEAIKGFPEDEYPKPALRKLTYKLGDSEIDVTATGFRGIPNVSTGQVEVFDEGCIAYLAHKNEPCEFTSKSTGVKTVITPHIVKNDPPLEFPVSEVVIRMAGDTDSEPIILISENLHTVIDINGDGFPDFWHSYSWHTSGAQNSGLHYSVTENGKLIRYETVQYEIPGC